MTLRNKLQLMILCILLLLVTVLAKSQVKSDSTASVYPDTSRGVSALILDTTKLQKYVQQFNADDEELYANIPNKDALEFLKKNIPLFECPDKDIERTYYFRWWTYRKHVKNTPDGYVITEFLPKVNWSGKHNTISCPAGHHFYEGRWLHNPKYLDNYAVFWFRKGGSPRLYSFWAADAMYARYLVNHNKELVTGLLDDLVDNYEAWEDMRLMGDGMFWQIDGRDGMEVSVGGSGKRATINSYMFGDALAIARIAEMAGREYVANEYHAKAMGLRKLVQEKLWDPQAKFFKTLPRSRYEVVTPKDSRAHWVPKLHWSDRNHRGTLEWVQYTFKNPRILDAVEVYWCDDRGDITLPVSWRILFRRGKDWIPVDHRGQYGSQLDVFNRVEFAPVKTDAIRMEVQSAKDKASGIVEWRALEDNMNHAPEAKISMSFKARGMYNQADALNDGEGASKEAKLVDVREQHGFTPWYFNLPDQGKDYEIAWKQLMDPKGFYAPYGPTTTEQRHPRFSISYKGHECQWNGPSWPLSTSVTLTALANVLNNYNQDAIGKKDYFDILKIYTKSHQLKRENGKVVPWIDENLNPFTGDWIARTRLKTWNNGTWSARKGGKERGKDYNHSSYCDLIISGLVGLRPQTGDVVEVNPLVPVSAWDWFCLDNVLYHDRILTVLWDKSGAKYGRGKGLRVFAEGKEIAKADTITRVTGQLPPVER